MNYVSSYFYVLVAVIALGYYLLPMKIRWFMLFLGSAVFYVLLGQDRLALLFFVLTIVVSYLAGLFLEEKKQRGQNGRWLLLLLIILVSSPLILVKISGFLPEYKTGFLPEAAGFRPVISGILPEFSGSHPFVFTQELRESLIYPLGCAFYTLQIIAYLTDISRMRIHAERNFFKFALFISFFPQIIQGPIPRYDLLQDQLTEGHPFDPDQVFSGMELILWGLFCKFMIADKAGVYVDRVFDGFPVYTGIYVLIAGILYSLQLYTDFLACTTISQGVALIFGIKLGDNFARPYFATSIRDFWRRWHISLSTWLKDYIYIPLGGSRMGRARKYENLMLTFVVSGIWHGDGIKYLFWGLMHAAYQAMGDATGGLISRIYGPDKKGQKSLPLVLAKQCMTFFWVMLAWIVFRAESLGKGLSMIRSMFQGCLSMIRSMFLGWKFEKPMSASGDMMTLVDDSRQVIVLVLSLGLLALVSMLQERKICVRDLIRRQILPIRWAIYLMAILVVMIFGSYGAGYQAADFIYGGF